MKRNRRFSVQFATGGYISVRVVDDSQTFPGAPSGRGGILEVVDAGFEDRARRRRQAMMGGVAHGHDELESADFDFWQRASGSERLEATWQLAQDAIVIASEEEDAPSGLQGPAFGTRRSAG